MTERLDETVLLRAFQADLGPESFRRLAERHLPLVWSVARRVLAARSLCLGLRHAECAERSVIEEKPAAALGGADFEIHEILVHNQVHTRQMGLRVPAGGRKQVCTSRIGFTV